MWSRCLFHPSCVPIKYHLAGALFAASDVEVATVTTSIDSAFHSGIWSLSGPVVGAWVQAEFDGRWRVNTMHLVQQHNSAIRNIKLEYSNNSSQSFELANSSAEQNINLQAVGISTTSVKITILSLYVQTSTGFDSIRFTGTRGHTLAMLLSPLK